MLQIFLCCKLVIYCTIFFHVATITNGFVLQPPPYLKFDHGRLIDISDDDEDENDDTNQERIPRPLSLATRV